jgi:FkbM family methyltransferase
MRLSLQKLRPAKIRSAVRRRWFERRLAKTTLTLVPVAIDIGPPYGGWTIPGQLVDQSWLCYSVGAGGDVSFDIALIERYGATVRSIEPVAEYVQEARNSAAGRERFSAHQAAIATVDGPIRMQLTHDERSHSLSAAGLYDSNRYLEVPGRTLGSLMAELGDDHIDLLKLDIEGSEYDLMPTLDLQALGVRVFAT